MRKKIARLPWICCVILAIILDACSGSPTGLVPASNNGPLLDKPVLKVQEIPCENCGYPGGGGGSVAEDDYGDEIDDGMLIGTPLSNGGFSANNIDVDFATDNYDDGFSVSEVAAFEQIQGYPPMSNACQEALSTLNSSFYGFMIYLFGAVWAGGKFGVKLGVGIGAGATSQIGSLNSAQNAVNIECSGQGAGQNPNGPLPPGYQPGT